MRPYYYMGGNRGLTTLASGELIYVDTKDRSISPWIIHLGYWEIFVDDILCALARPGDTFVDVGANMGYYTVKIGGKVGPTGKVYSFEPNREMYRFLRDNVDINDFGARAELFNCAVGARAGEAWLSFDRTAPGGGAVREQAYDLENEVAVAVCALDEVLPPDLAVDLVKIDVEGFEPHVLEGMRQVLSRSPDCAMVVEMVYEQWARFGDPAALLAEAAGGRDLYRIHRDGWMQPIPVADLPSLIEKDLACYVLALPPNDARRKQVEIFLQPVCDPRPVSLRLSRMARLRRRLTTWLNAD